jgi:glycosyltransferase involved in cell wall biosynthesis
MKVVCTIQDITPMLDPAVPGPHRVYLRLRIAWSLRRASHVIFTSEATYQETVKEFGPVERHSIIPLACDDPVPEGRIGANPYPFPYFFHVGRRRAHKNVGAIIRALACQHARGAHLVLGGREDIGDRTLIALAAEIGVANRLHFSGFLTAEQLATHYRHAEALVFPSLMEGFGIPILESMSYGCPVITSARSSMPEVAGNAALLVEPSDPECIAFAMGRVLSEPGLRSALREKGFSNGKRFSWKFTSEETARIYHGLWNRVPQEVAS